jgi:hypothetical protein
MTMPLELTQSLSIERSQNNQKIADVRRGGWLLSLEREQLSAKNSVRSQRNARDEDTESTVTERKTGPTEIKHFSAPVTSSFAVAIREGKDVPKAEVRNVATIQNRDSNSLSSKNVVAVHNESETAISTLRYLPNVTGKLSLEIGETLLDEVGNDVESSSSASYETSSVMDSGPPADENFGFRQIHLYNHGDQVQAWIRDSAIDSNRAATVVTAMQQGLKKNGLELIGLTINGKKVASLLQASQQRHTHGSIFAA